MCHKKCAIQQFLIQSKGSVVRCTGHTMPELCRSRECGTVHTAQPQCTGCQSCAEQGECGHRRHNVRLSSRCLPSHGYNTHSSPQLVFLNNAQSSSLQAALSVEQVLQSSLSAISNTLPLAVFSLHCTHPPSYALGVRPAEQIRFACPAECRVATQSIP